MHTSFVYTSEGGYQYAQRPDGRVVRIPGAPGVVSGGTTRPEVGQHVTVIVKPYAAKKYVSGMIKRVLTRKWRHTRGHKVMLEDGTIGRLIDARQ